MAALLLLVNSSMTASRVLQVDSLVEMTQEPKMHVNMATIIPVDLRTRLDDYLATRSSVDFHASLPTMLQVKRLFMIN